MIKRNCFGFAVCFVVTFWIGGIHAQSLKGSFGFGVEGGQQQLVTSDIPTAQPELGGEGILSYRFSDRISLNLAAGYSLLSYKRTGNPTLFTTNLITGNLFLDAEILKLGPVRPFIRLGFGGFNFESVSGKRYNDVEALGGGGIRLFLSRRFALTVAGFGKYTTGDDLDGVRGGDKDMYWGVRGGLTLYTGGQKEAITPEPLITEEATDRPPDTEMTGEVVEAAGDTLQPVDEQEVQRLQERKAALQQQLSDKEQEIEALRQAVARRESEIENLQGEIEALKRRVPARTAANFRAAYQQALQLYENRRYREAIEAFRGLLAQNPQHRLASNCWYWIGESYFALGELENARQAFNEVLNYRNSFKADDALLMLGRIYMRQGNTEMARQMFNRLLQEHPDSEYVPRAQQYLNRLR